MRKIRRERCECHGTKEQPHTEASLRLMRRGVEHSEETEHHRRAAVTKQHLNEQGCVYLLTTFRNEAKTNKYLHLSPKSRVQDDGILVSPSVLDYNKSTCVYFISTCLSAIFIKCSDVGRKPHSDDADYWLYYTQTQQLQQSSTNRKIFTNYMAKSLANTCICTGSGFQPVSWLIINSQVG